VGQLEGEPFKVDNEGKNSHRLSGRALRWARAGWLALAVICLGITAASWPAFFSFARQVCETCPVTPEYAANLAASGLTAEAWAAWQLTLSVLVTLGWAGMGGVIFARRSNDQGALLISALLLTCAPGVGGLPSGLDANGPVWSLVAKTANFMSGAGLVALALTLPNGRIAPRWTLLPLAYLVLVTAPNSFAPASDFAFRNWPAGLNFLAFFLPLLVTVGLVPLYRYWRVFTPVVRQQTQWAVLGILLFLVGGFATTGLYLNTCATAASEASSLYCHGIDKLGYGLSVLIIPVFIGVAILRSRLWDIDVIIRRTLIYSALTVVLGLAYLGSVLVLQGVFQALMGQGQNPLVVVLSTLGIAALFGPVRRRVQEAIDRRFYRKKYDAARTLATFGAQARDEVDLDGLQARLLGVVQETMQPQAVTLWLRGPTPPGGADQGTLGRKPATVATARYGGWAEL
jgi:hypothetical protein